MERGATERDRSGEVIGGRYQLTRQVGVGGMGTVYEATDTHGQRWALKLLDPLPGPKGRDNARRFAREIRALEAVRDPHVLAIVDADAESERPWFVTELLSGQDFEALLREVGRLPPATAVQIVLQIARGVAAVHARGLLHRDVKPSNVFLHFSSDGSVTAKLLDFGVAKVLFADDSLTESGLTLGTPRYMAPEQFLNAKRVDARVDVYSLGMTLYRALSGLTPFGACASLKELALRVMTEAPAPLQRHAPWVPPGLARAVHGAILRDRDARCPSMEALMERLTAFAIPSLQREDLRAPSAETEAVIAPLADLPARWSEVERDSLEDGLRPAAPSVVASLLGKTLGGRYRLHALLGVGGMGAVFEADSPDRGRVAVKVVLGEPARRPDLARRFVREGRATMRLTGAHVVHVIEVDVDQERGTPFMVMELLRGVNLGETIRELGPLEPEVAARIFVHVCEGLAEAHKLGIVHRDVKPTNLFLHRGNDGELLAKLCDFGIAKENAEESETFELTRTGCVLGTPAYMSPEQIEDAKSVDSRTDIWSVGASLFEALTGHRLWGEKKTILELVAAMSTQEPPSVQELAPWVDADLARVVQGALQRDPAARIAGARELADALLPFAGTVERLDASMLVSLSAENHARVGRPLERSKAQPTSQMRWRVALAAAGLATLAAGTSATMLSRGTSSGAVSVSTSRATSQLPPTSTAPLVTSTAPSSAAPASATHVIPSPTVATPRATSGRPANHTPPPPVTAAAATSAAALAPTMPGTSPVIPTPALSSMTIGPAEEF